MARKKIPLLVLVSAASGAGKTTLVREVLAARPDMQRAVTCTTRPPRPDEQDGVDYYFLTPERFARLLAAGKFIEHARVYGYDYGLLRAEVIKKLRAGTDVLVNVDVQGAATIRGIAARDPEVQRSLVTIFLSPPSLALLAQRLRKRGTDSEKVIARRLRAAKREIKAWRHFDYLIITNTVELDRQHALAIIESEKMRCLRSPAPAI
ncbi:MAG TPA: guanylate kinase [Verrucomicrobiae bacterium]|nr:guanylate kinase [Verrucomicrobiae bacterium]